MDKRRKLVFALGAGVLTAPVVSFAQQPSAKIPRIGFLGPSTALGAESRLNAFRAGLRELGYIEGRTINVDYRWAEGDYSRLPALAEELVQLNVDIIVTATTFGARAAKNATSKIPIVIASAGSDPVTQGLVASLARPGGNMTGSTNMSAEVASKRIELLKEVIPRVRHVAFLVNVDTPAETLESVTAAARLLKLQLLTLKVQRQDEIEDAFLAIAKAGVHAVEVHQDPFLIANAATIAKLALKHRLPSIGLIEYAGRGGMIGYGPSVPELYRRAAYFVDKILKGAKPGELPFERPTKFEMIVNLKTAKALGIALPPTFLARADKVIE